MKTNQSIPKEVTQILHHQRKRLAELYSLEKWSESDFEEIMRCSSEWNADMQGWILPLSSVEKLAFDARTPDRQARSLQFIARQMGQNVVS
ncbi:MULTISPECIES: hypothetical protein [unclassified Spirosoma]|uniref:hypothetical protein n=1 Tax=unclassified Spirosoma TaxID=2621999 RepID=UPI000962888D|nr:MULTISPECIES: hypothetical protein [unclassified Spirosoma]MBN8824754.1 hypothetical protein [Spirosoma sp.]OJW77088.1 MAG: hypothetical protein BGO59_23890 [Spirosoma sp. 48-14]